MQIVLNTQNKPKIIEKAINILSKGGIIVYPSDTVYGLAADATNPVAVDKIEKLKGSGPEKKFSSNFSAIRMIEDYHNLTDEEKAILEKYLPGPFTFILEDELSVRIPKNSIITEIIGHYGKPTTATSANLTGEQPVDSIKTLNARIYLAADLIIEDPGFVASAPSTLVDLRSKPYKTLRQGKLPFEG
jgi:L-threonylcarbamoyladenylate synthase